MKKTLFVSVEIAKLLKEKHFNDECIAYYCVTKNFEESIKNFIPENYELKISLDGHNNICAVFNDLFQVSITAPTYNETIDFLLDNGILINRTIDKKFICNEYYFDNLDSAIIYALNLI